MDDFSTEPADEPLSSTGWLYFHGHIPEGGKHGAEELFACDALALAIRADAGPFLRAVARLAEDLSPISDSPLRARLSRLGSLPDATDVRAETEYPVGTFAHGEGDIDIRVTATLPSGPVELWVEAKVRAPISGKQLFTYENARHHQPPAARALLLMLARGHPCRGHPHEAARRRTLPCLEWGLLASVIAERERLRIWEEFRRFIESDILDRPEGS